MVSYVVHGTVYHPESGRVSRARGIISGSAFTNIVDGIANLIMLSYSSKALGIDTHDIKVCGDDNLILTNQEIKIEQLIQYQNKTFGVMNNVESTDSICPNQDFLGSFLGSRWTMSGPERDIKRMVRGAIGVKTR